MKTTHQVYFKNSKSMKAVESNSVDLVVTSPPYPMIEMWDEIFSKQNSKIKSVLQKNQGNSAFELMNKELDKTWDEVNRVLKNSGIVCINIGDATRTINENFALYTNHSRIIEYMHSLGFTSLPTIIWRKQTNAPNKFMGSGMLPPGAYVTLEHEYILIFRKGRKREFTNNLKKEHRRESAYFWEERNLWFSDIWMDIKGTTQKLEEKKTRKRSGAFPFELTYRLINMFSVKEDVVLDPFLGTGTTMSAAITAGRNSIGYEIDENLQTSISCIEKIIVPFSNEYIKNRLNKHSLFVHERIKLKGKLMKYTNEKYGFPVVTNQERFLYFNELKTVKKINKNLYQVQYSIKPQKEFCRDWDLEIEKSDFKTVESLDEESSTKNIIKKRNKQLELF